VAGLKYLPKLVAEFTDKPQARTLADIVGAPVATDRPTGQFAPKDDLGSTTTLSNDDLEWAREHGATTVQQALDLVNLHRQETGEK